jgi:regulator of cell morphogenesis and NO signaling
MTSTITIDSSWTINEVIGMYPETVTVFNSFGMDSCCGGDETLEVAAEEAEVDRDSLMSALLDVAATSKAAKAAK